LCAAGDNCSHNVDEGDEKSDELDLQETSIHQPEAVSLGISKRADVLIAADVIYDRNAIPALMGVVERVLTNTSITNTQDSSNNVPNEKIAIFATTFRNADTFALFEAEIRAKGITLSYASKDELDAMPNIFPCYFTQPRTDVRICLMKMPNAD